MVGANERPSALAYRDACRRDRQSPAVSHGAVRATTELSRISAAAPMAKRQGDFGSNPFIPSRSPICRMANVVMMWAVTAASLIAAAAVLAARLQGGAL